MQTVSELDDDDDVEQKNETDNYEPMKSKFSGEIGDVYNDDIIDNECDYILESSTTLENNPFENYHQGEIGSFVEIDSLQYENEVDDNLEQLTKDSSLTGELTINVTEDDLSRAVRSIANFIEPIPRPNPIVFEEHDVIHKILERANETTQITLDIETKNLNSSSLQNHSIEAMLEEYKIDKENKKVNEHDINMRIKLEDLERLKPPQWLNDQVINYYFKILEERKDSEIYVFDTYFYPSLNIGIERVKNRTKNVDIFTKTFLFIPIHLGNHWCLCAVNIPNVSITYYDSLKGTNDKCLQKIEGYLLQEFKMVRPTSDGPKRWKKIHAKDIALQNNAYDCGVFICYYASQLSKGEPLNLINGCNMSPFRAEILYDILSKLKTEEECAKRKDEPIKKVTPVYGRSTVTPRSTEIKTSIPEVYLHQSANFHQGDKKYFKHQRAGVQCTAIATVACILLPAITVRTITSEDLDKVLIFGDLYYQECRNQPTVKSDLLNVEELLRNLSIGNGIVNFDVHDIMFGQFKNNQLLQDTIDKHCLTSADENISHTGFLFIGNDKTVAFFKCKKGLIWLFNSHGVDQNNQYPFWNENDQKARLFRCGNSKALVSLLLTGTNNESTALW
ncbi:GSCOCG00011429001-RA-CDS, partial [Cotesia congregata]